MEPLDSRRGATQLETSGEVHVGPLVSCLYLTRERQGSGCGGGGIPASSEVGIFPVGVGSCWGWPPSPALGRYCAPVAWSQGEGERGGVPFSAGVWPQS